MAEPLTVGINAQISPLSPGGVETMLLSLLRMLPGISAEEEFVLCSVPKHSAELLPFVGPRQRLLDWPFPQGYPPPVPTDDRLAALRARAGALRPWVDGLREVVLDAQWRSGPAPARRADRLLRRSRVRVVHFPYGLRFETRMPYVYEPWDLQHRHYPQFFSAEELEQRDRHYRAGCESARLVIAATRWVKRDLVEQYGIHPGKVAVIPRDSLLARRPLNEAEESEAWARHGLPKEFAFYPAMTFPHKNHLRLLRALARLRDSHRVLLPLVCTGRIFEPHWPAIRAELERLRLGDQVLFLGAVGDGLLASLFRRARFMVFPSLFEGLGAPLLEAMHHGLPILAANATSIPEVVGDAAALFDGTCEESILEALLRALRDGSALERTRARAGAILARFSWERAARTFIACYRRAANLALSAEQQALLEKALDV